MDTDENKNICFTKTPKSLSIPKAEKYHWGFQKDLLAKTQGLYQIPKRRNTTTSPTIVTTTIIWGHWGIPGGGSCENLRPL